MTDQKTALYAPLEAFRLPTFSEIPNVGLYLEQTTKYIAETLKPLGLAPLTGSMISNYVKKKIIVNPVKKQYDREQIAYLFFIAIAKSVLSLEDIQFLFTLQKNHCSCETAYDAFRTEFEQKLHSIFRAEAPALPVSGPEASTERVLLRDVIVTAAHKIYLEHYLLLLRSENE